MKLIKTLRQISILSFAVSKRGFIVIKVLLKIFSRTRFILGRHKRKNINGSVQEELFHTVNKLEPILTKVSDSLSAKPELFQNALEQVVCAFTGKDNTHSNKNTIIINPDYTIIEPDSEPAPSQEPNTQKLEQQLKNLFTEIKTAQFSGNTIINQIEAILDTGIHVTNQLNNSKDQHKTILESEKTVTFAPINWNDFIAKTEEVSLLTELLQVQVNQLMSCYEIN